MFIPYLALGCNNLEFNIERVKAYINNANGMPHIRTNSTGSVLSGSTFAFGSDFTAYVDMAHVPSLGGVPILTSQDSSLLVSITSLGDVSVTCAASSATFALPGATATAILAGARYRYKIVFDADNGLGETTLSVYTAATDDPPAISITEAAYALVNTFNFGVPAIPNTDEFYVSYPGVDDKLYGVKITAGGTTYFDTQFGGDTSEFVLTGNYTTETGPGIGGDGGFKLGSFGCDCPPLRWDPYLVSDIPSLDIWAPGLVSYVSPATDGAPWYDANIPGSHKFLGFMIEDGQGLLESTTKRDISPKLSGSGGGLFGPYHNHQREVEITALMFACDEEGMQAGFRFLKDALGYWTCSKCETCDMEFIVTCQDVVLDGSGVPTNLSDNRWIVYDVSLVEGPFWAEDPLPSSTCSIRRVKFKLASESPWLHTCPVYVVQSGYATLNTGCLTGTTIVAGYHQVEEPLIIGETAVNVEITALNSDVSSISVSLYPDQFEYLLGTNPTPSGWTTPDPCAQVVITDLPAGWTFTIDSAQEEYTVTSPSGETFDGTPYLYVEPGTIPTFLAVRCGKYTLEIAGAAENVGCSNVVYTARKYHREI